MPGMKKIFLSVILAIAASTSFGHPFYRPGGLSLENYSYAPLRVGVGFEKSPYMELGIASLHISEKDMNSGSFCVYMAGQLTKNVSGGPTDYLYGGKIGFETAWFLLMWGAELKYLTNEKESQMYFTPKVGISMLGGASLTYGYNTPTKRNKLEEVGRHQIALTVHLSKRLIRDFKASGTEQ